MKSRYTATYTRCQYIGTHPHISGTEGVYYWNSEQSSYVFRPDSDTEVSKTDWYRVHRDNLVDLE
jgi:hypothetical protein